MTEATPRFLADADLDNESAHVSERFHGGPEVKKAFHLDENKSLRGKKIFFIGNLEDRWSFDTQLRERGASVVTKNIDSIANPRTRLNASSKELRGTLYDHILVYMGLAFYKKKALTQILRASFDAIDFEHGGEFSTVSFDFASFEQHAQSVDAGPEEKELQTIMFRFFTAGGLDPYQGSSLAKDVRRAAKGRGLHVKEIVHERPAGGGYWEEIKDLCVMLRTQCRTAISAMEEAPKLIQLLFLKGAIDEFEGVENALTDYLNTVDSVLALPQTGRPVTQPPVLRTISVTKSSP